MGLFSSIAGWFNRLAQKPSDLFDSSSLELEEIDVDGLYEQLGIAEKAKEHGINEIPGSDATALTGAEQEIITEAEGKILNGISVANTTIKGLDDSTSKVDIPSILQRIEDVPRELDEKLNAAISESQIGLSNVREEYVNAERDYDRFRRTRKIVREPDYPESYWKLRALLFLLIVLASLMNGWFFAGALPSGLVGGAVYAFICGLTDVSISFWLGRAAPWAGLPSGIRKRTGQVAWAVFLLVWAPFWNLLVAHLRQAGAQISLSASDGPLGAMDEAGAHAVSSFLANPFAIYDFYSWAFVIIGALLSVMAFYDGFKWDDPIPGYRHAHKKMRQKLEDYEHEYETLKSTGEELKEEASDKVLALEFEAEKGVAKLAEAITTKKAHVANLNKFIDQQEQKCRTLITRYRNDNEIHRSTPPPQYFNAAWEYPRREEFKARLAPDERNLRSQGTAVTELQSTSRDAREGIRRAVANFQPKLLELGNPLLRTKGENPNG